ncbi:MAG: SAM-dependent chlorinase/fluorinase [Planctomycetota bacterium]
MAIITFTTDFGQSDHYIACIKGVVLQLAPTAQLVDVTHLIGPHDVVHGAFVLRQIFDHFPDGTIHVAVVDPGVGTTRRLIAARYGGQVILAPDNGLVSLVHRDFVLAELRVIQNESLTRSRISATFHGRDILAPIAGHLARGMTLDHVGPMIDQLELLNLELPHRLPDGGLQGQVLYVDHFGNLITNINEEEMLRHTGGGPHLNVHVGPLRVGPLRRTYGDVAPGEIVALLGSTGMLEVAVNQGDAAENLRAEPGTIVVVR